MNPSLKLQYHYSALPCPKKFLYVLSLLHTHSLSYRPQSEFNPNHSTKTLLVPVTVDLCLESPKVSSQFLFYSFCHQQLALIDHSLSLEQRPRHMFIVDLAQVGYSHKPKQKKCLPHHLFMILDTLSALLDTLRYTSQPSLGRITCMNHLKWLLYPLTYGWFNQWGP